MRINTKTILALCGIVIYSSCSNTYNTTDILPSNDKTEDSLCAVEWTFEEGALMNMGSFWDRLSWKENNIQNSNNLKVRKYKVLPKDAPEMRMTFEELKKREDFDYPLIRRMTHYDYFNQQDTIKELYDLYHKYEGKGVIRVEWIHPIGSDPNYCYWVIVYSQKNDTLVPEVGIIYE